MIDRRRPLSVRNLTIFFTAALLCSLPGVGTFDAGKMLGHGDARVTDQVYSHSALGPVWGAGQALGSFIDRAIEGRPVLRAVK